MEYTDKIIIFVCTRLNSYFCLLLVDIGSNYLPIMIPKVGRYLMRNKIMQKFAYQDLLPWCHMKFS
jgi:hypothetical protein